jgi:tetratricopeptide (TPR) repeat protein
METNDPNPLPDELRHKFPELRPVKKPPPLTTINGIGLSLYGKRDFDDETGTYIKTHCFCLIFVPLLALGAYRVAEADKGWYFIGREKLSTLAKGWNVAVLSLTLLGGGFLGQKAYTDSPTFHAGQQLARAADQLEAGNALEAARTYSRVATGAARTDEGRAGLQQALGQCLDSESPETLQAAYELMGRLPAHLRNPPLIPDAFGRGLKHVERIGARDPDAALDVLAAVQLLEPTNTVTRSMEVAFLKAVLANHPQQTNRAVELALIHETEQDWEACTRVLEPVRQGLGSTEGARILGQHLLRQGNYEEAYALLYPYVQERLEHLRSAEQAYTNAVSASYRRALSHLNDGRAPKSFYDSYDKASESEKEVLVDEFVRNWMERDAGYQRTLDQFSSAGRIMHVTLDLGIVQLNRAQSLQDPAARKAELEAAEQTFLAIRGMAGDTDEYRLFLGRLDEGRELFDQLLEANQRSYPTLMEVSSTLREVGEDGLAREYSEEAYRTAQTDDERYGAASLRARIQKDIEDQIAWLEKADPNAVHIQISLSAARGQKALADGQRDVAAAQLRQAIAGYEKLPKDAATLNNCGLVYFNLYGVTGNLKDHDRGLAMLEDAVTLAPGNSVLLINTASHLIGRAYMDVVGEAIHFGAIQAAPDRSMLAYLYANDVEREAVYGRLRNNEHMKQALTYLDKVLLLAPKSPSAYWMCAELYSGFRDLALLEQLQQRLQTASPDLNEVVDSAMQVFSGARDGERQQQLEREIARQEMLLSLPAVKEHPLTGLYVRTELNVLRQGAHGAGLPTDTDQVLSEARDLHRQQPCTATRAALRGACLLRLHDRLAQANPQYAALASATRRGLSPHYLMLHLIQWQHPLAASICQAPEFREAMELTKEDWASFPSSPDAGEWAMLGAVFPEEAQRMAPSVRANQLGRLKHELQWRLNPASPSFVIEQCGACKFAGDDAAARITYEQALQDGLPLPPL